MSKILPLEKIIKTIKTSKSPGIIGGEEYIIENYNYSPEFFTKWFNTSQNQLKRNGIVGDEYSLWITANCVESIKRNSFVCYYCRLDFAKNENNNPEFEHYVPRLQNPGSIVFACSFCNRLKADHTSEYYLNQLKDPKIFKGLQHQPENKHFAPLVALHNESTFVVEFMKKFITEDFKEKLISERKGDIIDQYCSIFRKKYIFKN